MGRRWIWVLLALTLAAVTAACSADRGNPSVRASYLTSAAASTVAARTAARSTKTDLPLPNYQPSKVVLQTVAGVQLSSTEPVSNVTRFYENVLKNRGWRIISSDKNAANTNLVAMRGTTGISITISRANPADTSIVVAKCIC